MLAKKFHWPAEDIAEARESLEEMARIVEPKVRLDVIKDAPDNRILECAVASGSDYIVSGDNHLLKLEKYDAIRMVSVADFLTAVQEEK